MGMGRIGWRRTDSDNGAGVDPWSDLPERKNATANELDDGDVLVADRPEPRESATVLEPSEVTAPQMQNAPMVIEAV